MKQNRRTKKVSTAPNNECCSSGVEGLDNILGSGLQRDCFYLIQGDPGSGKTTLALQFLLEGVRPGEKVFYVTLSETRDELLKVTRSHGWSLESIPLLELSAIEQLLRPDPAAAFKRLNANPFSFLAQRIITIAVSQISESRLC